MSPFEVLLFTDTMALGGAIVAVVLYLLSDALL